jgi:perosamine synthetase
MTILPSSAGQLAIKGGEPVRRTHKPANPVISPEAKAAVMSVLDSGALTKFYGGAQVREFEREYAAWFGQEQAVAVNSGTAALHVLYEAARLPVRSEVLVPANAYISAASALIQANLIPVIVDVDPRSWVMDPDDCARKLTPNTSALIAVHMYGQTCPMTRIRDFADKHGIMLFEDCGQSHGALSDGQLTGTFGQAAAFSLCCRKHVALGEGGMVITNDAEMANSMRSLVHKGKGEGWFDYFEMGYSYNMTEMQGVLGRFQLGQLTDELSRRNKLAAFIREQLSCYELEFPEIPTGSTHAYFKQNALLPARLTPYRNEIVDAIRAENVGCDPSHPHLLDIAWLREQRPYFFGTLPAGSHPDYRHELTPVATDVLARQICIEVGPGLDEEDLTYTAAAIKKVLAHYLTLK